MKWLLQDLDTGGVGVFRRLTDVEREVARLLPGHEMKFCTRSVVAFFLPGSSRVLIARLLPDVRAEAMAAVAGVGMVV